MNSKKLLLTTALLIATLSIATVAKAEMTDVTPEKVGVASVVALAVNLATASHPVTALLHGTYTALGFAFGWWADDKLGNKSK